MKWTRVYKRGGFVISDTGIVKRLAYGYQRKNGAKIVTKDRVLKQSQRKPSEFPTVSMTTVDGDFCPVTVARLMLDSWVGPQIGGIPMSLNGDKTDLRIDNLCWSVRSDIMNRLGEGDITRLKPHEVAAIRGNPDILRCYERVWGDVI